MATYVYRPDHPKADKFGMIDKNDLYDEGRGESAYVISDTMEPTKHMATGEYFTSKAKFRAQTRQSGCIEVGNETDFMLKPRKRVETSREERRHHIREAINYLRSR
jgi:hypothetical protein